MKPIHLFLSLFLFCIAHSYGQLPVIYAEGGDGKNIDWEKIEKEADPDGPGFFYNDCAMEFSVTKASSELSSQGPKNYFASNLADEDPTTAWVPESRHNGIGEYFEIASNGLNRIYNGYQANPTIWKNNSRVKKFKVYKDAKPLCFLVLKDEMGRQYFDLPDLTGYSDEPRNIYRFEIVEVYEGAKYKDVAVSEIEWSGCCFAENTLINAGPSAAIRINKLETGQSITAIDLKTGATKEANVMKTVQQKHQTLLVVTTLTHSIKITPDHPLFIKDYGFISFNRLMKITGVKDYSDLIDTIELMVWNANTNRQEYEKLSSISVEKGLVMTYSIRGLNAGTAYIANGFITKIY